MTTTRVSVVVPCYNGERYIAQTLEAILSQTHEDIEVIVVDDGSTDATSEIVQGLADERISYLWKENSGVSKARNLGLSKADGGFVAFGDSDDLLPSDFLQLRIDFLDSHPGFQGCCGAVTLIDEDGKSLPGEFQGAQGVEDILLYRSLTITCPSNYLFRTNLLRQWGARFNSRLSSTADRYFLLDVLKYGRIGYVDRGGALIYRYCSGSMSHEVSPGMVADHATFLRELWRGDHISREFRGEFLARFYYRMAAYSKRLGRWIGTLYYVMRSVTSNPVVFYELLSKRGETCGSDGYGDA